MISPSLYGHWPKKRMTSTSLYGHWPEDRMIFFEKNEEKDQLTFPESQVMDNYISLRCTKREGLYGEAFNAKLPKAMPSGNTPLQLP